jgi:hypothetical protein
MATDFKISMMQTNIEDTSENARDAARQAIKTMRKFVDDAEREINRPGEFTEKQVMAVMHAFNWGNANASTDLENASQYVSYMDRMKQDLAKMVAEPEGE